MESLKAKKRRCKRVSLAFTGLLLAVCLVYGPMVRPSQAETLKVKLSHITPAGADNLTGLKNTLNLKIPIPERWLVEKARLSLAYYHSTALLAERSRLVVRLNGIALAQTDLDPRSPDGLLEVDLPPILLLADYNDLTISAALNYTYECRDPSAVELWTNLKLDESYLEVDYSLADIPPVLSSIADFVFDPKTLAPPKIHLVLPDYEAQTLHWAALAAAGVALRYDYRPVEVTVSDRVVPESDNIVIGPADFLTEVLRLSKDSLPSGNLGLLPLTGSAGSPDDTHALIFMTGNTPEAIDLAARTFTVMSFPWPDTSSTTVNDLKLPDITKFSGKGLVEPGQEYRFEDLGLGTMTMQGFEPGPAELTFRLPSDFLAKANDNVKFFIHLTFSAGFRPDSALNLYLNGKFIGAIPLDDAKGGRYDAYQVQVSTSLLARGFNKLTCQPVLIPQENGPCDLNLPENLMVTLFGDSWIEVPELEQWVVMPEIGLFFQDGFPHTTLPDWRTGTIFLAEKDPSTVAAAMNLVALISQKTGIPPFNLEFTNDPFGAEKKDILALGSLAAMPEHILKSSPLAAGLIFPFKSRIPTMKMIRERLIPTESSTDAVSPDRSDSVEVSAEFHLNNGKLLLVEFESDVNSANTVLMVGANTSQDVLTGVLKLWDPAVQFQCRENAVLIDYTRKEVKVYSQRVGSRYYIGHLSRLTWLDRITHTYPMTFYAALALVILIAAIIFYRMLKRIRKKRLNAGGAAT